MRHGAYLVIAGLIVLAAAVPQARGEGDPTSYWTSGAHPVSMQALVSTGGHVR